MKKFFTFSLSLIVATLLNAQKPLPEFQTRHKNIYVELFGSHILAGINFDMRLKKGKMDGIGLRGGIGGLTAKGTTQNTDIRAGLVTFPLEFNHLIGKRRSSFETGIGILPVYATVSGQGELTDNKFFIKEGFGVVGGFLTLGYRYQPLKNGLMFQANWNPLILRGSGFQFGWIGIGIGMGFK
jgi:hypothetical protein